MQFARSLLMLCCMLTGAVAMPAAGPFAVASPQMASVPIVSNKTSGLLPSTELNTLLPATVFFSGQSAPLQLRNSAAFRTKAGRVLWAGLVDTSGYSTGVREKYQFYFVTEIPVTVGKLIIQPGVYGGGFLADNSFVLLNVAGTEIGRTAVSDDKDMRRPRPLQMTMDGNGLRLYLGRQYATLALR